MSWKRFIWVSTDEWKIQKMLNTVCSVPNLQLWALVKSFLYRRLQSSPLYSLWRSLAINRQESCTPKDNANALVSSNQSLSRDIYSFLEKASSEGRHFKNRKSWMEKSNDVFVRDSMRSPSLWGDAECRTCGGVMWFPLTLIQTGRLTGYVFSFEAMAWRSMYKWREHLTHLRAVQYNHCLVLLINMWSSVVIECFALLLYFSYCEQMWLKDQKLAMNWSY